MSQIFLRILQFSLSVLLHQYSILLNLPITKAVFPYATHSFVRPTQPSLSYDRSIGIYRQRLMVLFLIYSIPSSLKQNGSSLRLLPRLSVISNPFFHLSCSRLWVTLKNLHEYIVSQAKLQYAPHFYY